MFLATAILLTLGALLSLMGAAGSKSRKAGTILVIVLLLAFGILAIIFASIELSSR